MGEDLDDMAVDNLYKMPPPPRKKVKKRKRGREEGIEEGNVYK